MKKLLGKKNFLLIIIFVFFLLPLGIYLLMSNNETLYLTCIESSKSFHFEKTGFTSNKSLTFKCFEWFSENTSDKTLLNLIDNSKNNILKSYAYWAYINKYPSRSYKLLKDNLYIFDKIIVQNGDITYETTVADLWIDLSQDYLTTKERELIIETILNEPGLHKLHYYKVSEKYQ